MPATKQAFDARMKLLVDSSFKLVMRDVNKNLSGRMFNRKTGRMFANVQRHSKKLPTGFQAATTSKALIAWMTGAPRKGFFVRPKKARALSFLVDGKRVFSKGHFIPPWRFTPIRPAFTDAFSRNEKKVVTLAQKLFIKGLGDVFHGAPIMTVKTERVRF